MPNWSEDNMNSRHEVIWEHIDLLARHGVTEFSPTGLWRSLPHWGPQEYNDCIRVLNFAVDAGIMIHPKRGVYLLANAETRVQIPMCVHKKTGPHYAYSHRNRLRHCSGPVQITETEVP